jgi:hypothetical protein
MLVSPAWEAVSSLEGVFLFFEFFDAGMFPIRVLSPLIAIGIAGYRFLPETTRNILSLARRYEERVPVLKAMQDRVAKEYEGLKQETVKEAELVSDKLSITGR